MDSLEEKLISLQDLDGKRVVIRGKEYRIRVKKSVPLQFHDLKSSMECVSCILTKNGFFVDMDENVIYFQDGCSAELIRTAIISIYMVLDGILYPQEFTCAWVGKHYPKISKIFQDLNICE